MHPNSDNEEWKAHLLTAQKSLRLGDFGAAVCSYERALASVQQHFGEGSSQSAVILSELGECYEAQGQEALADECYQKVREILKVQHGELHSTH
jgi:tetratricopeptide (TPR) repeat protein